MIRLALLLTICSMTLCACKPGDSADLDATLRVLEERPLTTTQLQQLAAYVAASSVPDYQADNDVVSALIVAADVTPPVVEPEPSSSAYVAPPAPEPCDETVWRGMRFDCHGNNLGPVE